MPTIAERSARNTAYVPAEEPSTVGAVATAPPTVDLQPGMSQFMRCPLPPVADASPDALRQFYRGGKYPQQRLLTAGGTAGGGATSGNSIVNASVIMSGSAGSGSGAVTSVPASANLLSSNSVKKIVAAKLLSGHIYVGSSVGTPTDVSPTGDVTLDSTGLITVVQIEGGVIPTSAKITGTNASKQLVATALSDTHIYVGNGSNRPVDVAVTGDVTLDNTGLSTVVQIEGGAIPTSAKITGTNASKQLVAAALSDNHIYVGNGSNLPVDVAVTGDVSLADTGLTVVVGLEAVPLDATTVGAPTNAQVITYNLSASKYVAASLVGATGITIDGGSSAPTTGSKGFVQIPYTATITGWTLVADKSGSAQITVKKSTYAGFPTTASIVASAPPALSTVQKNSSATLTGWTTTIAAGDILEFNLDSVTTCMRLTLELQMNRS